MINGNLIGFAMFVLAALLITLPAYVLKQPTVITMVLTGAGLVLFDLLFRFRDRTRRKWLLDNSSGGSLFFIPVWIFGAIVIAANLINFLDSKR